MIIDYYSTSRDILITLTLQKSCSMHCVLGSIHPCFSYSLSVVIRVQSLACRTCPSHPYIRVQLSLPYSRMHQHYLSRRKQLLSFTAETPAVIHSGLYTVVSHNLVLKHHYWVKDPQITTFKHFQANVCLFVCLFACLP